MSINRRLKTNYTSKKMHKKKKKNGFGILKFIFISFFAFVAIGLFALAILYTKYISNLPSIKELENMEIAESSIIYDRSGNELYKVFKEKRTYKKYNDINQNMINAIVSGEDKRFFTNPGYDTIGLMRAVLYRIIGKNPEIVGTSTITQQLIRNTIIKNEKTYERKIKEIYLAIKLTNGVSKEKILELYLNKISFGSNSFGIEQASKTFFGTIAKNLGIFESSILASLPKGPTFYSPYNHPDRVVGFPYVYNVENEEEITQLIANKTISLNKEILKEFTNFIDNLKGKRLSNEKILLCSLESKYFKNDLTIDDDGCSVLDYSNLLYFLNSIQINKGAQNIEYQTGRKDFILGRMLEDNYITFKDYKEAILKGIGFNFKEVRDNIKYPHFVFYVKEYLENKYGIDILEKGGLRIYTTLDNNLQDKAEELVKKYSTINSDKYGATNSALIALDNENGGILAMVGGKDYFDKDNKGNVNIITSKLQPGSTFKPFVYSLGLMEENIGTKSTIYDVKTTFPGKYIPSNFDGKFMGKMNVATALNNSRNIPAIKMYYLAGGEKKIVNYMHKLGVKSLNDKGLYGAPLALGTGEMTPLELARAYSVFANMGKLKNTSPILKIIDSKGIIIEDITGKKIEGKQVIPEEQAYLITSILADKDTRPSFWNKYLSLKGRLVGAKTGTSTRQYKKGGKKYIFPRNLWTSGYTPQITTVVWAGNTDGKSLNDKGNGLEGAGPLWNDFMEFAHKGKKIKKWYRPSGIKEISISSISGLLVPEGFNPNFIISSLFKNVPTKYDNSLKNIQVDILCNGKVTESTPLAAISNMTFVKIQSLRPDDPAWENPVIAWFKDEKNKRFLSSFGNVITSISDEVCVRTSLDENDIIIKSKINNGDIFSIGTNYIELAYKSSTPIKSIGIFIGDDKIDELVIKNKTRGAFAGGFTIPSNYISGEYTLTLKALDINYYEGKESKNIIITSKDNIPPIIKLIKPVDGNIKIYEGDSFNLRGEIIENTFIKNINLYIDEKPIKVGLKNKELVFLVNKDGSMDVGVYKIKIEAFDSNFNIGTKIVDLEIMAK